MDTQGFIPDTVNLIADNLRDRYSTGFPIIKELIQNADDARAQVFMFARHMGFPMADHPLLQGPGIWFFNNGQFKPSDQRALRSFGINSKAGDAVTIGKFGLGMKSVFHLCEALFYIAWDGENLHHEALNPWKSADSNLHPEWDGRHDSDWDHLKGLAHEVAGDQPNWFLLWVPLRRKAHLVRGDGTETGAIIERFPGDDASRDLGFLTEVGLAAKLAEVLPLLRCLDTIEHSDAVNPFSLRLQADARLLDGADTIDGRVLGKDGSPLVRFAGIRQTSQDGWVGQLKARPEWPKVRYRDGMGHERTDADKVQAEAAVLFCSSREPTQSANLHWTVFLPLEEGTEPLRHEGHRAEHSLILHGQFFVDAGRRRVHEQSTLHEEQPVSIQTPVDEAALRQTWNRYLAQRVLAPTVIPALEHYVKAVDLSDAACRDLTHAICNSRWFRDFRDHACSTDAWVRVLIQDQPRWKRVSGRDPERLRPLPAPPQRDPGRPWSVFPRLADLSLVPCDSTAPHLAARMPQWQEVELAQLLQRVEGLFEDGPSMDYLDAFLGNDAGPLIRTETLQGCLVKLLRAALSKTERSSRQSKSEKGKRLISHVVAERRMELAAELPDDVLRRLWNRNVALLLVPKGLATDAASATPDDTTLKEWLVVLDKASASADSDTLPRILEGAQGLLKSLDPQRRGRFLRVHEELRIIAVRDAATGKSRAVSTAELMEAHSKGTLFSYAPGTQAAQRLGLLPHLAKVLPKATIWLVRSEVYRDLFPDAPKLPRADDVTAVLVAVAGYSGSLGRLKDRHALLESANDHGDHPVARRGLRYLLHGSRSHKESDNETLWSTRHDQDAAWPKLWRQLHGDEAWSLIPDELTNTVHPKHWSAIGVQPIEPSTLLIKFDDPGTQVPDSAAFSRDEREAILLEVSQEGLWQRLPLHTRLGGETVAANQGLVYLAPDRIAPNDDLFARAILIEPANDPRVAKQQQNWLKPLNEHARIELALNEEDASTHWRLILNALANLDCSHESELFDRLRTSPWLPTRHCTPVKPENVIVLPAGLGDEAQRLVAEHREKSGNSPYAVPSELAEEITENPTWISRGQSLLISSGEKSLEILARLLTDLKHYRIGVWTTAPEPETIALMVQCPSLPGWRLLEQTQGVGSGFKLATAWFKLREGLSQSTESKRLRETLDWLSSQSSPWATRKRAFDVYLADYVATSLGDQVGLKGLRLANRRQEWRNPATLCAAVEGSDTGLDLSFLLDPDQAKLLDALIARASGHPGQEDNADPRQQEIDYRLFQSAYERSPQVLADYFAPWIQFVPTPMIGVVIALMEPTSRDLASEYLKPHGYDWLLDQLDEAGKDSIEERLERLKVAVHLLDAESVAVTNLIGNSIQVPLDADPQTLLAGPISQKRTYRVQVPLRQLDPAAFNSTQLIQILRYTAESLCAEIYPPSRDLEQLWDNLDRSDQLEVSAARRKILHYVPQYLRTLSVVSHREIAKALNEHDQAFTEIAESGDDTPNTHAQKRVNQAMERIAHLIVGDSSARSTVLEGVRNRVQEFQYDPTSIPFELFQNADDATVERQQIETFLDQDSTSVNTSRVVFESADKGLHFLHWGRPINARGPAGFDENEERGFGRDLEKMLLLSSSDKQAHQGVTGKFGLGFKSVLLACDQPRIVSGRLAFEVVAGMLPELLQSAVLSRMNKRLQKFAPNGQRLAGTIIELPGIDRKQQKHILERFVQLAGLLCVFARAIRSIQVNGGKSAEEFTWYPRELAPGVESGWLHLRDEAWGNGSRALCIRVPNGAWLIALGPGGFCPLPKSTPAFWVTAPLRETDGYGFACTGNFDLDAGRARLAGESRRNMNLAQELGTEVGDSLANLFEHGQRDWSRLNRELELEHDLSPHDFWLSLWHTLTESWKHREQSGVPELARELGLSVLKQLSTKYCNAVPNGLKGPLQAMIDLGDARFQLDKMLATNETIGILADWKTFGVKYPRQHLVSEAIGRVLREGDMAKPKLLGISALIALVDRAQVTPEDAQILGGIHDLTEDAATWRNGDLQASLVQLKFRSCAETWEPADRLIAGGSTAVDRDEILRYAIAPTGRRLHPSYWESTSAEIIIGFFHVVRERLQAGSADLADWVLAANDEDQRAAALLYLVEGQLRIDVARSVRGQGWLADVLRDEMRMATLSLEQGDELRRLMASREQINRGLVPVSEAVPGTDISARVDMDTALHRIAAWWAKAGVQEGALYRQRLYPSHDLDFSLDASGRISDRPSWLTLFALGAFQSMGRTREGQHRAFVEHCRNKGWWETFAHQDPKKRPECWMDVIEKYAEDQYQDEEWTQWIGHFPKLYRLRRWMDDYVDLFLSIDRFKEPFTLEALLAPKTNPHFQGGGIDPPPLIRTLRVGGPLVIRELLHHGVITNPLAVAHAYAPIERIRTWFEQFDIKVETSQDIYECLCTHLGEHEATFDGAYDIPLRILTLDEGLKYKLFH